MFSNIKAVAFDIDGTLYPDLGLYVKIIPYFLRHLKFFLAFNKVRSIMHRTAPLADFYEYQARLLAENLGVTTSEAKQKIQGIVYDGLRPYFKKVKPFKYVEETFKKFSDAGLTLAILSDFPPEQKGEIWGVKKILRGRSRN